MNEKLMGCGIVEKFQVVKYSAFEAVGGGEGGLASRCVPALMLGSRSLPQSLLVVVEWQGGVAAGTNGRRRRRACKLNKSFLGGKEGLYVTRGLENWSRSIVKERKEGCDDGYTFIDTSGHWRDGCVGLGFATRAY